jgi:WD40 repeat protein
VRIVSGSQDKTVRVWDGESGEEVAVLKGHDGAVYSVCSFRTAEGAVRIVSGSYDKTVRVWDGESGEEVAVLKGHDGGVGSVCSFRAAEGAVRIVSGSEDKTVRIWGVVAGTSSSFEVVEVISGEGTARALHAPNARRLHAAIGSAGHPLIYALKEVGPA